MIDASSPTRAGEALVARLDAGDRRALPRLLTLVENRDPAGIAALDLLYPRTGRGHVVGVTGPPGSGKSTLVAGLVDAIRASGRTVAVVAIDPSSPLSGGAVLGDRIRMMARHADPGVFVRSMASRGRVGGLAPAAAGVVHALDAAGFPVILLETVGTGQDGIDVAALAHTVVVVQVPGLGDGVQAIKAGQLEVGDILAVNKADLPGADAVLRAMRQTADATHRGDGWPIPVRKVAAATGAGIEALLGAIDDHAAHLRAGGGWAERQVGAAQAEVLSGLRAALERRLPAVAGDDAVAALVSAVADRQTSPDAAIDSLLGLLDRHRSARDGGPVGDERGG